VNHLYKIAVARAFTAATSVKGGADIQRTP